MGFFKKIFKGIGKVFKKVGKFIKKGFRAFGKLVNKAGIFGQIGMMVLSMYAGPALWQSLSQSFIGKAVGAATSKLTGVLSTAGQKLASNKFGKIILEGAKRITDAATSAKRMTIDQLGSLANGTTNMVKSTMRAAGERLGLTVGSAAPQAGAAITPELTSVTYTPGSGGATAGSGVTAKASGAVTKAAGGEGLGATAKAIADNTTEQMAANFWEGAELGKRSITGTGFKTFTPLQQKEGFEAFLSGDIKGQTKFDPTRQSPIQLDTRPELPVLERADVRTVLDDEIYKKFPPGSRDIGITKEFGQSVTAGQGKAVDQIYSDMGVPRPTLAGTEGAKFMESSYDVRQAFKDAEAATDYSLFQPRTTGALSEAQKNFMMDTSKLDLGEFGRQTGFDPERQSPIAMVQQGSLKLPDFDTVGRRATTTAIQAGVTAAGMETPELLAQGKPVGFEADTASIMQQAYGQGNVGQPVRDFSPETISFVNNHTAPVLDWSSNAYNNWLVGAAEDQNFSYATS